MNSLEDSLVSHLRKNNRSTVQLKNETEVFFSKLRNTETLRITIKLYKNAFQ